MRKTLKLALVVAACLLGALALALCLASPVAKSYLNSHGKELTGRAVKVEKVRVNALGGRVRLMGLEVKEEDGRTSFLDIDTVDVKVSLLKLLRHNLDMRHAIVSGLKVNILQDGNRFNFSSIIDHFAPKDSAHAKDTTPSDWRLGFSNIRLSHWKVAYRDLRRGSQWNLKDVNLQVPGIYFSGDKDTDAGLQLEMADGGTITTRLDFNMQSNSFELKLNAKDFAVSNAKAYLVDAMRLEKMSGTMDGDLKATGNLSELLKTKVFGTLRMSNVEMSNEQGQKMWSVKGMEMKMKEVNLGTLDFDMESVTIDGAESTFHRYKDGNNYAAFFATGKKEPGSDKGESIEAGKTQRRELHLRVRDFAMRDSRFTYNDNALPDPLSFPVTNIDIDAKNVTLNGADNVRLTANLPHGGAATMLWRGKMRNLKENSFFSLNIRSLKLTDLSPYSVAYLAYPFTSGTFAFASENTIVEGRINGKNHLDVYEPEVGERRSDIDSAKHIPLKAVLYVLKDKDGRVQLDVPVSGNLDDPKFSYWMAVWKTLGNLLVKVAATPINSISQALGINSDELQFVPLDPMAGDFTSEQYNKLSDLARIAQYDSSIVIILAQQVNADAEDEILARAEQRNERAREYMRQLGVKPSQIMVLTQPDLKGVKQIGYKIDSELRSPDEE